MFPYQFISFKVGGEEQGTSFVCGGIMLNESHFPVGIPSIFKPVSFFFRPPSHEVTLGQKHNEGVITDNVCNCLLKEETFYSTVYQEGGSPCGKWLERRKGSVCGVRFCFLIWELITWWCPWKFTSGTHMISAFFYRYAAIKFFNELCLIFFNWIRKRPFFFFFKLTFQLCKGNESKYTSLP